MAMVELETVPNAEETLVDIDLKKGLLSPSLRQVMQDMTKNDELRVRLLIEQHMHLTNSSKARHVIENWDMFLSKFVKIMPVDYRRALLDLQKQNINIKKTSVSISAGE